MNYIQFWHLIDKVREETLAMPDTKRLKNALLRKEQYNDICAAKNFQYEINQNYTRTLKNKLRSLYSREVKEFAVIFDKYKNAAAEDNLLRCAAAVMGGICNDELYADFRHWLISQGEQTYLNALRDPDTLAVLETNRYPYNEGFGNAANDIYFELTNKDLVFSESYFEESDLRKMNQRLEFAKGSEKWVTGHERLAAFPGLCEKYWSAETLAEAESQQGLLQAGQQNEVLSM